MLDVWEEVARSCKKLAELNTTRFPIARMHVELEAAEDHGSCLSAEISAGERKGLEGGDVVYKIMGHDAVQNLEGKDGFRAANPRENRCCRWGQV